MALVVLIALQGFKRYVREVHQQIHDTIEHLHDHFKNGNEPTGCRSQNSQVSCSFLSRNRKYS
jgi:hypothetical protein